MDNNNKNKTSFAVAMGNLCAKVAIATAVACIIVLAAVIVALALKGLLMLCGWLF